MALADMLRKLYDTAGETAAASSPSAPSSEGASPSPGTITMPGAVDMPGAINRPEGTPRLPNEGYALPGGAASVPSAWQQGQGSFRDWFMGQAGNAKAYDQNWLLGLEGLLGQSGSRLTPANSIGERTKIWDPEINDWVRVGFGEGRPVWIPQGWGQNGPQMSQSSSYPGQPGQVFNDPATSEWEQLLRTINQRLQQPQPTYTDAQRDLMQTQALDPLERNRQAQKQNTIQRFAARGINPGSGVLEQALQDIDRQFDQMRSGQQTSFALNQIGREDQLFNSNEQRALAGLNLFSQIPQLADRRMGMAQGVLTPSNPYQLLTLQNQIAQQQQQQQNYNQAQDQQFWQWLGQLLASSFSR